MESEQLRRENDSSGPQDELEYWKRRGAQFSQLLSYLQVKFRKKNFKILHINRFFLGTRGSVDSLLFVGGRVESHKKLEGNRQENHILLQRGTR